MRNIRIKVLLFSLMLTAATVDVSAKRWRTITPAHSSKLDAARLAKDCETPKGTGCHFQYEHAEVTIIFSGAAPGLDADCPKMPAGTVLAVLVKFDQPPPLKNFRLKNQKELFFDPSYPPNHGYKGYYYPKEGFIISSYKGRVVQVVYIAAEKDLHLCPEYYDDPKGFVQVSLYP